MQRLRALFCTGAIKDTLEKERDYRKEKKNIISHKWCFSSLRKKTINLCGCEKQQSGFHMMHQPGDPGNAMMYSNIYFSSVVFV